MISLYELDLRAVRSDWGFTMATKSIPAGTDPPKEFSGRLLLFVGVSNMFLQDHAPNRVSKSTQVCEGERSRKSHTSHTPKSRQLSSKSPRLETPPQTPAPLVLTEAPPGLPEVVV